MLPPTFCATCENGMAPYFEAGGGPFYRCTNCGLLSRAPMPTMSELDDIYRRAYAHDAIERGYTNQETPPEAIEEYARYIIAKIPEAKSALDFGCGTGALTRALRRGGLRAEGLEFSADARAFAAEYDGLSLAGSLDEIADKEFDLILMIEVIEHLIDPVDQLQQMRGLLSPGGKILISTPNASGLKARLSKETWPEAMKDFHLHLFTPQSLLQAVSQAGFRHAKLLKDYPIVSDSVIKRLMHRSLAMSGFGSRLFLVASNGPR